MHLRLLVFMLAAAAACLAQAPGGAWKWEEAVRTDSIEKLADDLAKRDFQGFPRLASSTSIEMLPEPAKSSQKALLATLAELHAKIAKDFDPNGPPSLERARRYLALAKAAEKGGGYANLLFGDALRKLGIWELSGVLLTAPEQLEAARLVLRFAEPEEFSSKALLQSLAEDERSLEAYRAEIERIAPDEPIFLTNERIGAKEWFSMKPLNYSALVREPHIPDLMLRLAGTQLMHQVSLVGLVVFLEKGGKRSELNPADVRPFEARMAGEEKRFRFLPLDCKRLSEGDLASLYDLHLPESPARKFFLDLALK